MHGVLKHLHTRSSIQFKAQIFSLKWFTWFDTVKSFVMNIEFVYLSNQFAVLFNIQK